MVLDPASGGYGLRSQHVVGETGCDVTDRIEPFHVCVLEFNVEAAQVFLQLQYRFCPD